jgi:RNA methyltransferase, TrmH family
MITNYQIKFICSLHQKKFRDENQQYIAEGPKIISEIIENNFSVNSIFARKEWIEKNEALLHSKDISAFEVSEKELLRISSLITPNQVLAVLNIPEQKELSDENLKGIVLALDQISDPGNFGTIIRTADWFGIKTIICSENCVELYNPKVIQASMGSFMRIKIFYTNLEEAMHQCRGKMTVYGACTDGIEIQKAEKNKDSLIIIGNESKGISPCLEKYIQTKITIPAQNIFASPHAESLNASIAAALVSYEFTK